MGLVLTTLPRLQSELYSSTNPYWVKYISTILYNISLLRFRMRIRIVSRLYFSSESSKWIDSHHSLLAFFVRLVDCDFGYRFRKYWRHCHCLSINFSARSLSDEPYRNRLLSKTACKVLYYCHTSIFSRRQWTTGQRRRFTVPIKYYPEINLDDLLRLPTHDNNTRRIFLMRFCCGVTPVCVTTRDGWNGRENA